MIVDYFLVRRGNLDLGDLFSQASSGRYYYTKGVNLRGIAAFVIGFLLPLPGFIASFGTGASAHVSAAATDMFDLGWVLSFLMGGLSYWVICRFSMAREGSTLQFEEQVPHRIDTGSGHGTLIVDGAEIIGPAEVSETKVNAKVDV